MSKKNVSYHVDHLFVFLSPGSSALDLRGKMFTLSRNYGGVTFYPPYYDSVSPSTTDYPTRRHKTRSWIPTTPPTTSPWGSTRYSPLSTPSWTTNRRWTYPWTTESPTRGEYKNVVNKVYVVFITNLYACVQMRFNYRSC